MRAAGRGLSRSHAYSINAAKRRELRAKRGREGEQADISELGFTEEGTEHRQTAVLTMLSTAVEGRLAGGKWKNLLHFHSFLRASLRD